VALKPALGSRLSAFGKSGVELRSEHQRGAYASRVVRAAAREFLRSLRLQGGAVSVLIVGDARMRALNRAWRGRDRATDVLSFPSEPAESRRPKAESRVLGDIAISLDTARRQAREGGWPLATELRRLLAHGLLHCLGHDHERPDEARRMARAERALLGESGMVGDSLSACGP
jgi:probable rRNA maturation factor